MGGHTYEGISYIPSPDDSCTKEGEDQNNSVDKLKPRTRHMEFILLSDRCKEIIPKTSVRLRTGLKVQRTEPRVHNTSRMVAKISLTASKTYKSKQEYSQRCKSM